MKVIDARRDVVQTDQRGSGIQTFFKDPKQKIKRWLSGVNS
jgi:hypothetical protein